MTERRTLYEFDGAAAMLDDIGDAIRAQDCDAVYVLVVQWNANKRPYMRAFADVLTRWHRLDNHQRAALVYYAARTEALFRAIEGDDTELLGVDDWLAAFDNDHTRRRWCRMLKANSA
jgi:hypothetical protein